MNNDRELLEQEPVAWMDFHGNVKNNEEINDYIAAGWGKDKVATYSIPLYAAPVQPVKQEPVAWRYNSNGDWIYKDRKVWDAAEPLYTAPVSAKREWVDLTLQELQACCGGELSHGVSVHAAIAAFKENNK